MVKGLKYTTVHHPSSHPSVLGSFTYFPTLTKCTISFCVMKIEVGATSVRVGSLIFGNRDYPNSAANTPSPSPEKKAQVLTEEAAKKMEHLTVSER